MKKQVIRIGDTVRVIHSKAIRRVGYPLVWYDLMDEVEADPRTRLAYEMLTTEGGRSSEVAEKADLKSFLFNVKEDSLPRYFLQACAKLMVERRAFGGNTRSLHYYPLMERGLLQLSGEAAPDMTGQVHEVQGKRVVKTGIRVAPASGVTYGYDGPDYWDEPGGLDDEKTHVLLMLSGWEFEQCSVELVKRRPK